MIPLQNNIPNIRLITALVSLLISSIAFYSADVINRDGIFYLEMAQAYDSGGLNALLQYSGFGWPFYSILIAHVHQITQLSFESSAYVLNSLLFVLFTDTLVRLSNKLLENPRQVAIAAAFLLCFLTLNHYRAFLGRDIGYWAFCSLALYQFILYIEKSSIQKATVWQVLMITAVLFRVDGAIILIGLPLYLFVINSPKHAIKQCFQFFYIICIAILVAMFIAIEQSSLASIFSKIGSITKYINLDTVLTNFNSNIGLIETQILNKHSGEYSALILSSGLMIMLLYKLIKALTLSYIGIYIYSRWKSSTLKLTPYKYLILYFLALNIIILTGFIFTEYFVSRRYTVPAVISLLLLMLPRICDTVEKAWLSKHKSVLVIVGIILFVSLLDSLIKSNSKLYIKDVAIWASNNLPKDSTVLTDNKTIKYYFAKHQPAARISLMPKIDSYQKYDYLIVIEKDEFKELEQALATMNIEPLFKLENKRGNKATVYTVHPTQ